MADGMARSRSVGVVLLLAASLACGDSVALSGTWSGSNASYASVILTLTEVGDSLAGSLQVTPTGGSPFTTTVSGEHTNAAVHFRGDPLPPSVGGGFGTTFSGALTFAGQLAGCLSARQQPCSQILLRR